MRRGASQRFLFPLFAFRTDLSRSYLGGLDGAAERRFGEQLLSGRHHHLMEPRLKNRRLDEPARC